MHVTVENTGSLGRRMTVAVPAERFENEVAVRLRRLSQTARFPGFRPGKAPMKMVEAQYAGKVLEEVAGDLIRSTFYEAINEQGLKPAGGPNIEPKSLDRGKDFEYTAVFEIYPEVKRVDIGGCSVERPVATVQDADIDRTLEALRRQRVIWQPVDRAAASGDRVMIDFQGSVAGTPFEGGAATDFPLVLGNNTLIDGFESGLIGVRTGESRTLNVAFPAEYRNQALAGKPVQFDVTVKQVTEPVLPEIGEEFARTLGVSDGSMDTLRAEVRGNLEREVRDRARRDLREQVFKALIEVNKVDVPKALEQAEIDRLIQMSRENFQSQGLPVTQVPSDPALYVEQARRRVVLGLVLAKLVESRKLVVDASRVRTRIEEMAASYDDPQEFVRWHYGQVGRLREVESQILEDQAVDILLETADVVDKTMSFQDLTRPAPRPD